MNITDILRKWAQQHTEGVINDRRDFHRYPEVGWTEYRTASLVARRLVQLGYEVHVGPEVMDRDTRMGLPCSEELDNHMQRALKQGGDREMIELMRGGFPAVVAVLRNGEGPCIGLRFDMDALPIIESNDNDHLPQREGFASQNAGVMHACGHDGHTAIGLALARMMMEIKSHFSGTLKLIFQPSEEGVRGAKSMVKVGVVDDVDYFIGHHLFAGWRTGELICGMNNFAATEKMDIVFTGKPSHAGSNPHGGNNAMLAAATAVMNLHAIARHSDGATRVNVGSLHAGMARNVICPNATIQVEVRGENTTICDYMAGRAETILKTSAQMHDCQIEMKRVGGAENVQCHPGFTERMARIAKQLGYECMPPLKSAGSEDISWMINRVIQRGGEATLIGVGADRFGIGINDKDMQSRVLAPHTSSFDFDEAVLPRVVELLGTMAMDCFK